MTSIADLFDPALFKRMVEEKYIRVQRHPTSQLFIANYTETAQYDQMWNEATMQSRGLIYDLDGNVVARPFPKFFNWMEHENKPALPRSDRGPFRFLEKMDGSLGIIYQPDHDRPYVATRGSFTSEQAIWASNWLIQHYPMWQPLDNATYLVEIIAPWNRIVVDYGSREDLVLLDVLNNSTGESLMHDQEWPIHHWPGTIVETHAFDSLEAAAAVDRPNAEGFVIYFPDTGFRMKIKHEEYVRLHRLITGVNSRRIWEMLSSGNTLHEMVTHVPEEFEAWVTKTAEEIYGQFYALSCEVLDAFNRALLEFPAHPDFEANPKKAFALTIKDEPHKSALFALYDDKPVDEWIWKQIKPEFERPYQQISEDVA